MTSPENRDFLKAVLANQNATFRLKRGHLHLEKRLSNQKTKLGKDYTLASCKYMLGEARSKFATISGPQGGSTLNGDTLKAEAQSEMEKLEVEVSMAVAGGTGYGFTIG